MLFNSVLYLLFFGLLYLLYWTIPASRRVTLLIMGSMLFYAVWGLTGEGWVGIRWTLHFLAAIGFSHFMNVAIYDATEQRTKKRLLTFTIVVLLINLAVFKYAVFFLDFLIDLGVPAEALPDAKGLFLPLAISFYTFQIIAFTVDVYRGTIKDRPTASSYFLFILFFPQLIAGPIMRSTDFLDQKPFLNSRRMYDGGWLIVGGLIKKVLLADPMGNYVAPVFGNPTAYTSWSILLAGMSFSLQVYCDFSGYTDMARGSALLLGYSIPENFKAPFFSLSARELWQRWHITLTTWLRDYIYIPLGGNRVSVVRNYFNQFLTFALGGLWHGADYTYIFWGGMWGILLAVERFVEQVLGIKTVPEKNVPMKLLKGLFMFVLFAIGALMFRSQPVMMGETLISSTRIMGQMLGGLFVNWPDRLMDVYASTGADASALSAVFGSQVFALSEIPQPDTIAGMFVALIFFHFVQYKPGFFERWRRFDPYLLPLAGAITGGFLLPALSQSGHQFIYFVF